MEIDITGMLSSCHQCMTHPLATGSESEPLETAHVQALEIMHKTRHAEH